MTKYRRLAAWAVGLTLPFLLVACNDDGNPSPVAGTTIQTLSGRADTVSGDSALVEIKLPAKVGLAAIKVTVGNTDVSSAFTTRSDGRTIGLVTGLALGANTLTVTSPSHAFVGATLILTNHPIGGPVLLGSQATPWICATPVPTAASATTAGSNASGLSTSATDAQCNIATEYKLWYRTTTPASVNGGADGGCSYVLPDPSATAAVPNPTTPASSCFQPYVAGTTPAGSIALTTTSAGVTLPYIVRVERGTLNRGIYDIAVLFDPTKPAWTATTPQPQWNGKVFYTYGFSTGQPRQQYRSEQNWAVAGISGLDDDTALRLGFIMADNSLTDSAYNSNRILVAETTMMMKEHIAKGYGEIKYTTSSGCSGGAINQNTVASTYPGLLDGIQPTCDFSDDVTTFTEVFDCALLVNAYLTPEWQALTSGLTAAQVAMKKAAIEGHRDSSGCVSWTNSFSYNNKPGNYAPTFFDVSTGAVASVGTLTNNCNLPAALVYDPVSNPTGTRCGDPDLSAAVWGTTTGISGGASRRALDANDNVGVQYGLKALLSGAISSEEFVTLNEKVGGTDADYNLKPTRSVADTAALAIAYRAGLVSSGKNLAKVAIIDSRGYDEEGIHYNWRSFSERARLDSDAGSHANQVIWRYYGGPAFGGLLPVGPAQTSAVTTKAITTMDSWLSFLLTSAPKATMNSVRTQAQVVAGKPAAAVDFCYLSTDVNFTTPIADMAVCDADPKLAYFSSPHQVAGGPQTENILKCQLKPIDFTAYAGVTFTATQQTRLNAVFAGGVCDWTKPGVGQQDPVSPLTFTAGPGGTALPPEPTSSPI